MEEVTFKPVTLAKVTLLQGCVSRLLNCINGTKVYNASHLHLTKFDFRGIIWF